MKTFVKDVMTTSVFSVREDTPFTAIAGALHADRVSAFPVLNEVGQVVGVVSESDLLPKLALGCGEDRMPGMISGILAGHQLEKARALTAADLMSSPATVISPDDTVEDAARLMYVRRFRRLPVVDVADDRLVGIVSQVDVLTVYDRPDIEIAEEILSDIAVFESRAVAMRFDATARNGVVTLTGRPLTCAAGHDIVRRARHVHGVVAVRDRLDYPPPGPSHLDVLPNASRR